MKLVFILVLTIGATFAHTNKWGAEDANGVSALTTNNFDEFISSHPAVFIKFFAPWCGHCKTMAESYARLAQKYNASGKEVVIAELDATIHSEVASQYSVTGYPTLKFFKNGVAINYSGSREADAIEEWIEEKLLESDKPMEINKWGAASADGVSALTTDNFNAFINKHPHVFVKFFAPWCAHCKTMAASYAQLARKYNESGKEVVIAELDATQHGEVSTKYGVEGYPSLKFFFHGEPIDYKGARESDSIEEFIERKIKASFEEITTVQRLAEIAKSKLAVVLYGNNIPQNLMTAYKSLTGIFEDVTFYTTKLSEVKTHASNANKSYNLIVFRNFESGTQVLASNGELTSIEMRNFINKHRHAAVLEFTEEIGHSIFGSQKTTVFFFSDSMDSAEEQAFNEVASSKKFEILFVRSKISEGIGKKIAEFIGVFDEDDKTVRLIKFEGQDLLKYKLFDVTANSLTQFIKDFNAGELLAYKKSQRPVDDLKSPVKTIVGDNFDDRVLDSDQYVLLEVYAPWCAHCKELIPIYEELGKRVAHNKQLLIAKMDGTANEHSAVVTKGFPTIKFYKKGEKDTPMDYNSSRTIDEFLRFLKREMGSDWVEKGDVPLDEDL